MKIKIEAECRRGLRIIEEIPDLPLCRIEGYNGIGKTNAIKLLRLCAGEQPFAGQDASWRTFREQLTRARITVTELNEASEIEWLVEPHRWPSKAEPPGELLGAIRISGHTARPRDIQSLFQVYHVLAAKTPVSVLSAQIQNARDHIQDWDSASGRSRQAQLDDILGDLKTLIGDCAPAKLAAEFATAREAKARADELALQAQRLQQRVALLDQAVDTAEHLAQVQGRGPEMQEKLVQLQERLDELDRKKEQLNKQISEASAREHKDRQAEREFDNAQKHLGRCDRALRDADSTLEKLAAFADVAPHRDALDILQNKVGAKLTELTELRPRVHSAPLVIDVLNNLASILEQAEGNDLGAEVLFDSVDGRLGWTITDWKETCLQRAAALRERAPSADAEELGREIEHTRNRLDALSQMSDALDQVDQARLKHTGAQERLRAAAGALPEQTARTLEELIEARDSLDQQGRDVQAEHIRLTQVYALLGGGLSEEMLAAELDRLCTDADVDAARVRGRRDRERVERDDIQRKEAQAAQQAEFSQQQADKRSTHISRIVQELVTRDEFSWLRRALPLIESLREASIDTQAETLDGISVQLEKGRDLLERTFTTVRGVGSALGSLATELDLDRHISVDHQRNPFDAATRWWLAEEVRRWFADDLVRIALFDGGDDIRLDANNMNVFWTVEGETRQRSLSAFSSGQQAFAFTQAQVAQLDREESPAANRLIALDEFGAFLDSTRMSGLAQYLTDRPNESSRDQVVVILPHMPHQSAHSDQASIARIEDLERRGYFAEALRP
ncbi:hypothetical protein [Streptomyces sp. NPDC008139]|uniref:hypothetical protein n=1 Tax=Streptomyces sp. NPDC008139 TaxID=3364814 RepID=UPI0036E8F33E